MKTYLVPIESRVLATAIVQAKSKEEALTIAKRGLWEDLISEETVGHKVTGEPEESED